MTKSEVTEQEQIAEILNEKKYRLGELWRRKESLGVLIPILSQREVPRSYVLLEEVQKEVELKDTGAIDGVGARNNSGKSVFIRSGSLFEGIGTQSRSVTEGTLLEPVPQPMPPKPIVVPVKCVYLSHPISNRAGFTLSKHSAPARVHRALYTGDQGKVWSSVSSSVRSMSARAGEPSIMAMHDNLIGSLNAIEGSEEYETSRKPSASKKVTDSMNKIIREIPSFENQCGLVVLDENGVVGLEWFDSSKSWDTVSKSVIEKYGETFTKKAKTPFKVDIDKSTSVGLVRDFIEKLTREKASQVSKYTAKFGGEAVGEFNVHKRNIIHVIAFRKEQEGDSRDSMAEVERGPIGVPSRFTRCRRIQNRQYVSASLTSHSITPSLANPPTFRGKPKDGKILTSGWSDELSEFIERRNTIPRRSFSSDPVPIEKGFLVKYAFR